MKTPVLIAVVIALHVLAVGSVFFLQGCGTTPPTAPKVEPDQTQMPPSGPEAIAKPKLEPIERAPIHVPAPKPATTKTYVVQSGDSISLIAQRFNVSVRDVLALNHLSSPNKLRVGQKLELPSYVNLSAPRPVVKAKPAAPKAAAGAPKATAGAAGGYSVKSGDTLGGIAYRNGTTVKAIKEANHLASDRLQIGQKLVIPGGKASPAAPASPAPVAPAPDAGLPPVVIPPGAPAVEVPAPVAPPMLDAPAPGAAPAAAAGLSHIVDAGQDLPEIAMMYSVSVDELKRVNNLTNDAVKVGDKLKIPSAP